MARASASIDSMSKWLVGSSTNSQLNPTRQREIARTKQQDMWVFHCELSKNNTEKRCHGINKMDGRKITDFVDHPTTAW